MIRKLAALISLAVALSGSFALSTQSVDAKNSRNRSSGARNYLVPPPPPYIPTLVPAELGMLDTQAVIADADDTLVEKHASTVRNSSRRAQNCFVPPPPPNTPSIVLSALGMRNSRSAAADDAVVEKSVNSYSKYIFTRNQGDMPQVGRPNPYLRYDLGVEKKVQNQIDYFDSEISNHEKKIGKLLNL